MSSFKPIDPKRDEIRRYLERGSVLDSLTKIFIRIIKERPENPMEYIRNNIGMVRHQHDKYERLSQDLQEANEEIQRLRAIINSIDPEVLQSHVPHVPVESEDSEPVTAAQKDVASTEIPENVTAIKTDELATAVENCHIEENNVAADAKVDSANQSSSVQTESTSTNNTE
ncbi:c-Myc-binding protein homolog [Drosophila innubila]|uniref:c-Myc-binding protein homolog n=1 Tax=Drosophila innubila TaxID=198719 RepID=UPI00148D28B7|nr:c-Myc-binding protein homolog [Drosophila innubila]